RILLAHNGRTALDIAQREEPDLLLLDLRMPELDGIGVLEQVRQDPRLREMAVIVITATGLGEQIAQFAGEMVITLPHPLAAGEWLHILGSVTAALQPVPGTVAETLPAHSRALPG
ncbi:MAG: response regulator, partial [Caldilineaceae bacterium]|nr:response regulator [Caldilineaceae bacterium]